MIRFKFFSRFSSENRTTGFITKCKHNFNEEEINKKSRISTKQKCFPFFMNLLTRKATTSGCFHSKVSKMCFLFDQTCYFKYSRLIITQHDQISDEFLRSLINIKGQR